MLYLHQIIVGIEGVVSWFLRYFQDNPGQLIGMVVSVVATLTLFWRLKVRLRKYKGGIIEAFRDALKSAQDKKKGKHRKIKDYSILLAGIGGSGKTTTIRTLIEAFSLLDVNNVKEITDSEDRVMDGKTPPDTVLVRSLQFEGRTGRSKTRLHFLDPAGELLEPLSSGSGGSRSHRIRRLLNSVDLVLFTVKISKDLRKQKLMFERLISQESDNPIGVRAHIVVTFLDKVSLDNPSEFILERWASLLQSLENSDKVKVIPTNPQLFKRYQNSPKISVRDKIGDLNVDELLETLKEEIGLSRRGGRL